MRKKLLSLFFLVLVIFTVGVSIWGPETLSEHRDRSLLGKAHLVQVEMAGEGYRYKLSREEKLFILSQALKSQEYLESSPDIGARRIITRNQREIMLLCPITRRYGETS